jgi:uncharacterized protein DUF898
MQPVSASDVTDVVSSLPDEAVTRYEPFRFTGTGGEYFRIWIVNVMLSVVTLGIYSAWAKVRRLQYFYRHTRISSTSFDYHGKPLALLKGRILASCLFGGYYAASAISPAAGVVAFAMLAARGFSHDRSGSASTTAAIEGCGSISMEVRLKRIGCFSRCQLSRLSACLRWRRSRIID